MIPIILMIVSIILDGFLTNIQPYLVNQLSILTPLLTVVTIFIIYPFYRKKEKKYFITIFILGLIYDLFYTNLLFVNSIVFTIVAYISYFIYKNYEITPIRLIIYTIIIISSYELITALIFIIFRLVPITIPKLFYKITHSLLLNIIYIELVYLIIKLIPKKYKRISIN